MSELAIAFYWHQHQPYYPDDVSGQNPMPWVRLHGVKDYVGMALHLLEFPAMHCTINLVPSLLAQIQAYAAGRATDRPLEVSRIPAHDLTEADALYLLDTFFMANPHHMIAPFPRYQELYLRRAPGKNSAREALRRFKEHDLRDLQVWFNLAWVHPLILERDADLRLLIDKGRRFSEEDKLLLLGKHLGLLKEIIPLHKKLLDSGQVELTTTPFYHPILPLLLDKKLAREAMPDVKLPRFTGGYVEDAALHVRRALDFHTSLFGVRPRGMWPAEGSVCQPMIPLLAEHGVKWIGTDEEVLTHSTQGFISRDEHGQVRNPEMLYRPFRVKEGERELSIVFRDHALSDMIGFHYQRSPGEDGAEDFIKHSTTFARRSSRRRRRSSASSWTARIAGNIIRTAACRSCAASIAGSRPRPAFARSNWATIWRRARRATRCRTCSRGAGFTTTSRSGSATKRTTRPGTPFAHPRIRSRPGPAGTPAGGDARAGLGGNLHRRGERLVLVVRRRSRERPERPVRPALSQAPAERVPDPGRSAPRRPGTCDQPGRASAALLATARVSGGEAGWPGDVFRMA